MENATRLTCLVLEPVTVVAEDLVAMVEEEMPGTRMLVVGSAEMAAAILRDERVDIAFLNLTPMALARTDLAARLEQMSATVVLMGHGTEALAEKYRFLELPFASFAIAQVLRAVVQRMAGIAALPDGLDPQ